MKRPASGSVLVVGFALVAIGAIALNLYVNAGEGSLRAENDPKRKASPSRTVPTGDASLSPVESNAPMDTTAPDASIVVAGVVMAEGAPFEGARVSTASLSQFRMRDTIARVRRDGNEYAANAENYLATSGKDGRFELGKLPPAPFRLKAEAPGWIPAWAEVGALGTSTRLDGFVLELVAAGGILGRVTAGGKPVAGAMVVAGDETTNDVGGSLQGEFTSASDGAFALESVRPGKMTVAALHPRFGFAAAVVDVTLGGTAAADLSLAPLGRVRGRIVGADGKPIAGVGVSMITSDLDLVPKIEGVSVRLLTVASRIQETDTDADGRFEFRTLMSRTPRLGINGQGYKSYSRAIEVGASGEAPDVEITLQPTGDSR